MRFPLSCLAALLLLAGLGACDPQKRPPLTLSEQPRSILIVPVVNQTTQVDAADNFLTTLAVPLAELGYYVFPTHMVKRTMEDDGLADANLVHSADPMRTGELFGADAILYAQIEHWESKYLVLTTQTTVGIRYTLKSGITGETLWTDYETLSYSPQVSGGGHPLGMLIAAAVAAAVERAAPSYIPLAQQVNYRALVASQGQGLPPGPYHTPAK